MTGHGQQDMAAGDSQKRKSPIGCLRGRDTSLIVPGDKAGNRMGQVCMEEKILDHSCYRLPGCRRVCDQDAGDGGEVGG